jgi:phosphate transport system substrate-binding protein
VQINGAGATFPLPVYTEWTYAYQYVDPAVVINYQGIGSGGGIRQFMDRTVQFGATDGPMTDSQITAIRGNVLHIPTVLGAVVPVYNLPGVTTQLKFTPDILAGFFLGQITRWNDSRIAAANPGVQLPEREVIVVHRSDGSGTTYVFTDYLAKVSADWTRRVGRGTAVNWPVGLGGQGNPGVASTVSYALVRNRAGGFINATLQSTTAAAGGAVASLPDDTDFRISITDAEGAEAYPIAAFTWILLPRQMSDAAIARPLLEWLWWATHDGQRFATELGYAALPQRVVQLVESRLRSVTLGGRPVLPPNYGGAGTRR